MRAPYFLALAVTGGLLAYAYYLQFGQGLEPCPLCMVQRLVFFGLAALFLAGGVHNPGGWGGRVYGSLSLLLGLGGAAVAGRHLWLQSLPPDQVPACGPSLSYMLDTMPFAEVMKSVLLGDGECAEIKWSFLGLSMPAWTLFWYLVLACVGLYYGWKAAAPRYIFRDG